MLTDMECRRVWHSSTAKANAMVRVTISSDIQSRLLTASDPLELCDPGGRVVGHFIPVTDPAGYRGISSPTPAAELDRRSREEPGLPLGEVLADLRGRQ